MATETDNRGSLHDDDIVSDDGKKKGGLPKPVLIAAAIIVLLLLGAGGIVLYATLQQPAAPTDIDGGTTTETDTEPGNTSTGTGTDTDDQPDATTETVEVEGDDEDESGDGDEGENAPAEDDPRMYENSSDIPMEVKAAMVQGNEIDDDTEEKYAQYGALNIDQMKEVSTQFVTEWVEMINDGQWDEHSTVLKSMMDINYVNDHSTETHVRWLYECLHDSLYVSSESLHYNNVKEVQIINSIPSPLTYTAVTVNATVLGVDEFSDTTVRFKLAMNKEYKVCQFNVAY